MTDKARLYHFEICYDDTEERGLFVKRPVPAVERVAIIRPCIDPQKVLADYLKVGWFQGPFAESPWHRIRSVRLVGEVKGAEVGG